VVKLECLNVIAGDLCAELVYSNDPISFVGGVNIRTGDVSDYRHSSYKLNITGKAFAFPYGKGSSGAGLVLMEMMRIGTAPAALINIRTDPVVLTGPLICKHFYNQLLPVINLSEENYRKLADAKKVQLFKDQPYLISL
jgi:predicted aconitase with swiveling domain